MLFVDKRFSLYLLKAIWIVDEYQTGEKIFVQTLAMHETFSRKCIDFLQEIGYYIQVPHHFTENAEMIH